MHASPQTRASFRLPCRLTRRRFETFQRKNTSWNITGTETRSSRVQVQHSSTGFGRSALMLTPIRCASSISSLVSFLIFLQDRYLSLVKNVHSTGLSMLHPDQAKVVILTVRRKKWPCETSFLLFILSSDILLNVTGSKLRREYFILADLSGANCYGEIRIRFFRFLVRLFQVNSWTELSTPFLFSGLIGGRCRLHFITIRFKIETLSKAVKPLITGRRDVRRTSSFIRP